MNASSSTPSPRPAKKKPITPEPLPPVEVPRGHLILSRRIGESIRIGDDIDIVIHSIRGGRARVGILCPHAMRVSRNDTNEKQS